MAKEASVGRLVKIFRRYQGCNFGAEKAKELIAAAKDSFYSGKAARSRGISICMQIEEIASLLSKVKEIELEIKSILDPDDPKDGNRLNFDILNSIKGVGIGTIAAFIAAVYDGAELGTIPGKGLPVCGGADALICPGYSVC